MINIAVLGTWRIVGRSIADRVDAIGVNTVRIADGVANDVRTAIQVADRVNRVNRVAVATTGFKVHRTAPPAQVGVQVTTRAGGHALVNDGINIVRRAVPKLVDVKRVHLCDRQIVVNLVVV